MSNGLINKIKNIKGADIKRVLLLTLPFVMAFFIPFILAIILFTKNGYYPFKGDGHSLAMIDMSGQYMAFFRYYKTLLDGEVDIIYTLGKVTGGDFLSIFTYYLASPFNLLVKFYPVSELPKVLIWIVVLKISTAGLTAYIALQAINKNGCINLLFSVAYALMTYNIVYYSNIMWLDGVLALPLVALGIHYLVNEKSLLLYVFSLAYTIATSWYIGIMVAMFSVFFFLFKFFSLETKMYLRKKLLLTFVLSSLLAGLFSFGFWGTAFVNLLGTKGSTSFTNLPKTIKEFYNVVDIERGFLFGNYAGMSDIMHPTTVIYAGALPLFLMLMFFANPRFNIQKRVGAAVLVLIYLFAFFNEGIDHLFHGGPAPNWFPGRYGFIFSFIVIYLASLSMREYKHTKVYAFIPPVVIYIALVISLSVKKFEFNKLTFLYFGLALFLLVGLFLLNRLVFKESENEESIVKPYQKYVTAVVSLALIIVSAINVYGNSNRILLMFNNTLQYESMDAYRNNEKIGAAVDFVKERDKSLYRLEKSFIKSESYNNANNDAMYFGYNGISHYSSSEKRQVMEYMRKIGFHYNGFNFNYANGSTLAINSYLGIKYLLDKGDNRNFDFVRELPMLDDGLADGINTYENIYVLPFLMPIEKTNISYVGDGIRQSDDSVYWFDMFEYQNHLFKTITRSVVDEFGDPKDIFKKATYTTTLSNVTALAEPYHYKVGSAGNIYYDITLDQDTNYYYYIKGPVSQDLRLYERGSFVRYFSYHGYQLNGLRRTTPTAKLNVNIKAPQENIMLKEAIYYEDLTVLGEYIAAIKDIADVNIKQEKTSHYTADVITNKDDQYMLLTLPYNRNLRVFVDGKRVETTTRFNIFTGFTIPSEGPHKIKIKYVELTYQIGLPMGILSAVGTIVVTVLTKNKKKKEQED